MSNNIKTTIGLTSKSKEIISKMMDSGYFGEKIHAAKFALVIAIQNDVVIGETNGAETVWNVGSFDPKGELKDLIMSIFDDCKTPYKDVEYLVNYGLNVIGSDIEDSVVFDLHTILEKYK